MKGATTIISTNITWFHDFTYLSKSNLYPGSTLPVPTFIQGSVEVVGNPCHQQHLAIVLPPSDPRSTSPTNFQLYHGAKGPKDWLSSDNHFISCYHNDHMLSQKSRLLWTSHFKKLHFPWPKRKHKKLGFSCYVPTKEPKAASPSFALPIMSSAANFQLLLWTAASRGEGPTTPTVPPVKNGCVHSVALHCFSLLDRSKYGLFWLKPAARASCRCVRCFLDPAIRCASSALQTWLKRSLVHDEIGSIWIHMDPWSVNSCELRHALHMSYRAALEPNERFQRLLKHTERVRRVRI